MVYIGPLVLGFIIGFILGTRIKQNPDSKLKFGASVFVVLIIVTLLMAYQLGPFPYYTDSRLANGLLAALAGIIVGKLTFGR
ncbi:MAG: energy-converting hydrogenase B subunit J [Methanobacterium paludis]|nr:energy-converting hydrogenase B subunit J [Methanobacterium paludis]